MAEHRKTEAIIQELLDTIPATATYDELAAGLKTIGHVTSQAIAARLQTAINAHLRTMPQETYDQKREVSSWVNEQLREHKLAIKCPNTGRPAILVADMQKPSDDRGRFRMEIRQEDEKEIAVFPAELYRSSNSWKILPVKSHLRNGAAPYAKAKKQKEIEKFEFAHS